MLNPYSAAGTPLARALPVGTVRTDVAAAVLDLRDSGPVSGYIYDPAVAARRARQLRAALPAWATLLYAVKANNRSMKRRIVKEGSAADGHGRVSYAARRRNLSLPPVRAGPPTRRTRKPADHGA